MTLRRFILISLVLATFVAAVAFAQRGPRGFSGRGRSSNQKQSVLPTWENDNIYYFRGFSEKKAYPLVINIVFYSMTH